MQLELLNEYFYESKDKVYEGHMLNARSPAAQKTCFYGGVHLNDRDDDTRDLRQAKASSTCE
jgi:hypothetical protein